MRTSVVIGIDRRSYLHRERLYSCLSVLDVFFSSFVLAPFIVAFWSSTWQIIKHLDLHLPIPDWINLFAPSVLGFCMSTIFTVLQRPIQVILTEYISNRYVYFLASRLYTEIFGIASVASWYGIWTVLDHLVGEEVKITTIMVILSYAVMIFTKTVRNVTASPYAIVTDRKQGYFDVPTLFRSSYNWKTSLYILDSSFSVVIIGTLGILVWRGAWILMDANIFPGEDEKSEWTSLGIGYVIVFVTFLLQIPMKILIRSVKGYLKLIVLDMYVIFSFCGTINVWRGIWMLVDTYAGLSDSALHCILTHLTSFFILVILNSSNTLLVRGVSIDGEENDDNCVEFPCYFFRLIFQEKQKEKSLAILKSLEKQEKVVAKSDGTSSIEHHVVTKYIDQDSDEENAQKTSCKRLSNSERNETDEDGVSILKDVILEAPIRSIN